jgi:hypothetical protein
LSFPKRQYKNLIDEKCFTDAIILVENYYSNKNNRWLAKFKRQKYFSINEISSDTFESKKLSLDVKQKFEVKYCKKRMTYFMWYSIISLGGVIFILATESSSLFAENNLPIIILFTIGVILIYFTGYRNRNNQILMDENGIEGVDVLRRYRINWNDILTAFLYIDLDSGYANSNYWLYIHLRNSPKIIKYDLQHMDSTPEDIFLMFEFYKTTYCTKKI